MAGEWWQPTEGEPEQGQRIEFKVVTGPNTKPRTVKGRFDKGYLSDRGANYPLGEVLRWRPR